MSTLTEPLWPVDTSAPVLELTVGELLRRAAAAAPDRVVLVSVTPDREDRAWSYAELCSDAERAAIPTAIPDHRAEIFGGVHRTPQSWYTAANFPVNAMGKLQKFRLCEQIAAGELEAL